MPHVKDRIYPVGRLDWDTNGLLILTNDGDFVVWGFVEEEVSHLLPFLQAQLFLAV